ncbi:hypothetical protein [Desulfovibrio inopinatus]|uniref:phosphorylase family protein n=1 Tax=Desulfovibrio inopinatus TaxID=102109 RepID=UPI00316ABE12
MASEAATVPHLRQWYKNNEDHWESNMHTGHVSVRRAGIGQSHAYACAKSIFSQGAPHIVVFGVAGGLSPHLLPGDIVISSSIIPQHSKEYYQANPEVLRKLTQKKSDLDPSRLFLGDILSCESALCTPSAKEAAYRKTHALAVDMESAGVARAAKEANRPFVSIRVVCDPANRTVPEPMNSCLTQQGTVSPWRVFTALCNSPGLIGKLPRMQKDYALALDGLRRVWKVLL